MSFPFREEVKREKEEDVNKKMKESERNKEAIKQINRPVIDFPHSFFGL
jgi:hypothetical protein